MEQIQARNQIPVFDVSHDEALKKVILAEFMKKTYPPAIFILEKNKRIDHLGYICSGRIDLLSRDKQGRRYRNGGIGKGNFFGIESLFGGEALFDGLSVEQVCCYIIEPKKFIKILSSFPDLKSYVENLLHRNLEELMNNPLIHKDISHHPDQKPKPSRFEKSMAYIESHYMDPITLDEVADVAGLSRFYFSRMFKQETGHTFKEHLNIKRLEVSKKLLHLPGMNVSQTCYSVGFNDVAYFARLFKRYEGMSPSCFRKNMREDNPPG